MRLIPLSGSDAVERRASPRMARKAPGRPTSCRRFPYTGVADFPHPYLPRFLEKYAASYGFTSEVPFSKVHPFDGVWGPTPIPSPPPILPFSGAN